MRSPVFEPGSDDLVPSLLEVPGHVRTEESRGAGDEDAHPCARSAGAL